MILKLTTIAPNQSSIYVNFAYVRTMQVDGLYTKLVMSDDKFRSITVTESCEEIYNQLYPVIELPATLDETLSDPEIEAAKPAKRSASAKATKKTTAESTIGE